MEKAVDVVIIGGGIIGLSIAYYLALKKAGRILLFEKGQLGEGRSVRTNDRFQGVNPWLKSHRKIIFKYFPIVK